MEELIKIFKEIQNTTSTKEKKEIISRNSDDASFVSTLRFLFDSNIITNISDKRWDRISNLHRAWIVPRDFVSLLKYVEEHNSGSADDVLACKKWCCNESAEVQEFVKKVVTKKLKIGCDKKLINSAIPGLIPTWEVQQAYPISEKNEPKDGEWFALSQKINGTNASYYKGEMISRQGKNYFGLSHIIADIEKLPMHEKFLFNGELIRKNKEGLSDNENFQLGTGIINSSISDKTIIKFIIYECIPIEEFERGESKMKYRSRRSQILNPLAVEISHLNTDNLEVVPIIYEGTQKSVIPELLKKADDFGWEGLMLNKDTTWKNRRNSGILKIKSFHHADIRCTGISEGGGKYQGMLGMIKCNYKGYELGVGSGFTDEQRIYYWKHPEEIIGKIVQIKFKGESKNKNGGLSVQFPIFEIIRTDKTEPSYN